eukprot:6589784-Prymnesium_polylepis.4
MLVGQVGPPLDAERVELLCANKSVKPQLSGRRLRWRQQHRSEGRALVLQRLQHVRRLFARRGCVWWCCRRLDAHRLQLRAQLIFLGGCGCSPGRLRCCSRCRSLDLCLPSRLFPLLPLCCLRHLTPRFLLCLPCLALSLLLRPLLGFCRKPRLLLERALPPCAS